MPANPSKHQGNQELEAEGCDEEAEERIQPAETGNGGEKPQREPQGHPGTVQEGRVQRRRPHQQQRYYCPPVERSGGPTEPREGESTSRRTPGGSVGSLSTDGENVQPNH